MNAGIMAMGAASPGPVFSGMLTKFGLASSAGYFSVWCGPRVPRLLRLLLLLVYRGPSLLYVACPKSLACSDDRPSHHRLPCRHMSAIVSGTSVSKGTRCAACGRLLSRWGQ